VLARAQGHRQSRQDCFGHCLGRVHAQWQVRRPQPQPSGPNDFRPYGRLLEVVFEETARHEVLKQPANPLYFRRTSAEKVVHVTTALDPSFQDEPPHLAIRRQPAQECEHCVRAERPWQVQPGEP
jgi:hypothetical protein